MAPWIRIAVGLVLGISLMGFVGLQAYSKKLAPLVQEYGITYYNGEGPVAAPLACKPHSEIVAAIGQVHAKYDHLEGPALDAFLRRAASLKGLPPLNVDELYVITEDEKLHKGEMVLLIGLKVKCVTTVFGFPARLYQDILGKSES